MNFSGVSLHSPEIGVCQLKVYGDIQNHHNMSSTLHILSTGKYKHHMKDEGLDGILLERNGKLTMWKSKSSRLS